jgi:hypothetical protein
MVPPARQSTSTALNPFALVLSRRIAMAVYSGVDFFRFAAVASLKIGTNGAVVRLHIVFPDRKVMVARSAHQLAPIDSARSHSLEHTARRVPVGTFGYHGCALRPCVCVSLYVSLTVSVPLYVFSRMVFAGSRLYDQGLGRVFEARPSWKYSVPPSRLECIRALPSRSRGLSTSAGHPLNIDKTTTYYPHLREAQATAFCRVLLTGLALPVYDFTFMKIARFSTPVAVSFLGMMVGFALSQGGRAQLRSAQFVPFTAKIDEEHFETKAARDPASVTHIMVQRTSDGSEVNSTSVTAPDAQKTPGQLVQGFNVASKTRYVLEPFTHSIMTDHFSAAEIETILNSKRCPSDINKSSEHSKMLGLEVVRHREKTHFDNTGGTDSTDGWMAPELGCFTLKEIYSVSDGPWNRTTVLSLIRGEPPSSMFDIPTSYVERRPSEMSDIWKTLFGAPFLPDSGLNAYEKRYLSHQSPQ